jgi:hypothetical protein
LQSCILGSQFSQTKYKRLHVAALLALGAWVASSLLAHHVLLLLAMVIKIGRCVVLLMRAAG